MGYNHCSLLTGILFPRKPLMHAVGGAMPTPGFATVSHLMIYKDQVELVQKIGKIWGYPANLGLTH